MADPILNIYQGETVNYTDTTVGDPATYSWSLPGGIPNSSTGPNPSVVYNNIGTYPVSLTVTDIYSVTRTTTKSGIIQVSAAPWGVSFTISPSASFYYMGQEINLVNTSIGSPSYAEWTFPDGGGITSGITFSYKASVGPLKYEDWEILTGSHSGVPGTLYTEPVTLYQSSAFALGSATNNITIKKIGPYESYSYLMDYILGDGNNAGSIYSLPRGSYQRTWDGVSATGPSGIGLRFTYATEPGPMFNDYYNPVTKPNQEAIFLIECEPGFLGAWNNLGPTGPYYPHVDTENFKVYGRAYSPFNTINGSYVGGMQGLGNYLMLNGQMAGPNIMIGSYTTPAIPNVPPTVFNPEFFMSTDGFTTITNPESACLLSIFIGPNLQQTFPCIIPKTTIEKLLEHPNRLPTPSSGHLLDPPTIGMVTSADINIQNLSIYNFGSKTYFNTTYFNTISAFGSFRSSIGKYPCVPSQWGLAPGIPSPTPVYGLTGAINGYDSSQRPFGLNVNVDYGGPSYKVEVFFGYSFAHRGAPIHKTFTPISIDPQKGPGPLYASAFGNDFIPGASGIVQSSWIYAQDTQYGPGIASYINAYINDPKLGIPGGTGALIAKAIPEFTLPTPFSDNPDGATGPGGGSTGGYGLSIEILDPQIRAVTFSELYGEFFSSGAYQPFSTIDNTVIGVVPKGLLNTPMTFDIGSFTGQPSPYMDPGMTEYSPFSWLSISSRMEPLASGAFSIFPNPFPGRSGIQFGKELN